MLRKLSTSLVLVITFSLLKLLFSDVSYAISFPANYDVTYTLKEDSVHVTEQITITNQTDNQYPSQYTLALEGIEITNISARDSVGTLTVVEDVKDEYTLLTVNFNAIVIGKGNKLEWTLEYDASGIVKKVGTIREVSLPQVQHDERIQSYKITVISPVNFGELDYSDPLPNEYTRNETERVLTYQFEDPKQAIRVILAFGETQIVDAELYYHLQNTNEFEALYEIALPPSQVPYQKTYIKSLDPEPYFVRYDLDGNILVQYLLSPQQKLDVTFKGQVFLNQKTLSEINATQHQIPGDTFIQKDNFWDIQAPIITTTRSDILDSLNDDSTKSKAEHVYQYVTDTLSYDFSKLKNIETITRNGAVEALNNPQKAICTDYTDVTISLMRSMGIPAREVNGYAFTDSADELPTVTDVLHAWVQIYLPEKGWVQIDPTWGSTADLNYFEHFDTNHVIFVLKGESSEYPYPAGSYKIPGEDSEDVHLSFSESISPGSIPITLWADNWIREHRQVDIIDWIFLRLLEIL